MARGGYVLADAVDPSGAPAGPLDVILIATGSELSLAMEARERLTAEGIRTRVVSLPCWERFEAQPQSTGTASAARGDAPRQHRGGRLAGLGPLGRPEGAIIAIDRFGASAPAGDLFPAFGFTAAHVAAVARKVMTGDLRGVISAPFAHEAPAAQGVRGASMTTMRLPDDLRAVVDDAIGRAVADRWATRLAARDTTLWTTDPAVAATISNRLGWLDAPVAFTDEIAELEAWAEGIRAAGFAHAVVCGMGGSSLAPDVLAQVLPVPRMASRSRSWTPRTPPRSRRWMPRATPRGPSGSSRPSPARPPSRSPSSPTTGPRRSSGWDASRPPTPATRSWPSRTRATASRPSPTATCSGRRSSTLRTWAAATRR
ncbi:MAG: transketolase C-terminal domain-containing protein [Chloroflexota bacterium]